MSRAGSGPQLPVHTICAPRVFEDRQRYMLDMLVALPRWTGTVAWYVEHGESRHRKLCAQAMTRAGVTARCACMGCAAPATGR